MRANGALGRAGSVSILLALLLGASDTSAQPTADGRTSSVGLPATIREMVLPGSELEVKPANRKDPVVVRIVAVRPHGSAFRYDLEWVGLEAKAFDLREYLRRKDGTSTNDLPPIPITVETVLPQERTRPADLDPGRLPRLGGYRLLVFIGAILWMLGLAALLYLGRKQQAAAREQRRPLTLAERLRPIVEAALQTPPGTRPDPKPLADLERGLIAFWSRRLHLEHRPPTEAIAELRRHAEAGPLLSQLERWLHTPGPVEAVDVAALLAPYRELPADALGE